MAMANTNNMIILISFILFIASITTTTITTSNETDFLSLIDFKNRIESDPSQIFNSWNDSIPLCEWHGITCGRKHKRVTVLNVSSLDLVGTLSPSIGNLTFLRHIHLYKNSFYGIIPQEIGRLFRLQNLILANNSFEGLIPSNLSSCKNLRVIHFYGNKLSGRIPYQLGALPNLLEVAMGQNNFNTSIPPSLGNISTLQKLDLTENSLTGNIPHELGKLFKLQILGLGMNYLSGPFPLAMYNISSIQILSIPSNYLTGQIPDSLGLTLPNMIRLAFGSNSFSGSIPSTLANASDLETISIGDNNLTGPIPRNLGRLQYLEKLELFVNPLGIHSDIDISIILTLTNCTNLKEMVLSRIEIGGILPSEISNLSKTLQILDLSDNHLSGHLPDGIGELIGLNYFSIGGNNLSGCVPLSIGKLTNMAELFLNKNRFTGEIPPSIGDMSRMLKLYLYQNMLTGSIPLSLSNLTELRALSFSQNHLNGIVPPEIFSITSQLLALDLDDNKFIGPLPSELGNLKQLVSLRMSRNELSGEIPISIGGCEMLQDLQLNGNFLEGTIPSSLGQLKGIEFIDLSRNKLLGEIPASLEKLKFISLLNLSFNMLEGEIPKNGVFANASAFSIVGNKRLCGGIKSLNLHECPTKISEKHRKLSTHMIVMLVICILITMISLFGCTYAINQARKYKRAPSSTSAYDKQLLPISYAEILTSTNGFSSENLIGEGKYGSVYRGVLKPSNKVVAVKVLKLHLKGAHMSFMAECEALRNIRHINLVKIITSCSSIDFKGNAFKALILEYVPNGSLEDWLHQNSSIDGDEKKLDFLKMLNIAIDVATALDYLHNHSGNPIVHCDIKPSNILLGNDLRGLVSDFGIAKFLPTMNDISHGAESTSIGIRGTIGYVAPEYGMGGDVSTKGDIYSYGILLLEMFTGKRPTNPMFTDDFTLHNYVKNSLDHHVAEIIDPRLLIAVDNEENISKNTSTRSIVESCCLSIFKVGVSCSSEMQNERMNIKDALIELQQVRINHKRAMINSEKRLEKIIYV